MGPMSSTMPGMQMASGDNSSYTHNNTNNMENSYVPNYSNDRPVNTTTKSHNSKSKRAAQSSS